MFTTFLDLPIVKGSRLMYQTGAVKPCRFASSRVALTVLITILLLSACTVPRNQNTSASAFASWHELIELATSEASRVDQNSVLSSVFSDLIDCAGDAAESTNVTFYFSRPSNEDIRVSVRDTSPPSIVEVRPTVRDAQTHANGAGAASVASQLNRTPRVIAISPREACKATIAEAEKTFGPEPVKASVYSFVLDTDYQNQFGGQSVWNVAYRVLSTTRDHTLTLRFVVSAETGDIIKRYPVEGQLEEVTPTP